MVPLSEKIRIKDIVLRLWLMVPMWLNFTIVASSTIFITYAHMGLEFAPHLRVDQNGQKNLILPGHTVHYFQL